MSLVSNQWLDTLNWVLPLLQWRHLPSFSWVRSHAPSVWSHRGTYSKWFSRFPANESLRKTGFHLSLSAKSSFYLPAFEISRNVPFMSYRLCSAISSMGKWLHLPGSPPLPPPLSSPLPPRITSEAASRARLENKWWWEYAAGYFLLKIEIGGLGR